MRALIEGLDSVAEHLSEFATITVAGVTLDLGDGVVVSATYRDGWRINVAARGEES